MRNRVSGGFRVLLVVLSVVLLGGYYAATPVLAEHIPGSYRFKIVNLREKVLYPDAYHTGGTNPKTAESSLFKVVANPNLKKCVGADGKYNGAYEEAQKIIDEKKVTKYEWKIVGVSDCILQESDNEYGYFSEAEPNLTTNCSGVRYTAGKDTVNKIKIICIVTLNADAKEKVVYTGDISVFMLAVRMVAYGTSRTIIEYGDLAYDGVNHKQKLVEFKNVDAPNSILKGVGLPKEYQLDATIASLGSGKDSDTVSKTNVETSETWEVFGYTKGDLNQKINCASEVKVGYCVLGSYTTKIRVAGPATADIAYVVEKLTGLTDEDAKNATDIATDFLLKDDAVGYKGVLFKELFTNSTGVGGIVGGIYVDYPIRAGVVGGGFYGTYQKMIGCDSAKSGPSGAIGWLHDLSRLKKVQNIKIEPGTKVSGRCQLLATLTYKKSGIFKDVEGAIRMLGTDPSRTICITGIPTYVAK